MKVPFVIFCRIYETSAMIIVRLKSGMGNQMFQYAMGLKLSLELDVPVRYDLSSLLDRSRGPDFVYRNYDLDIFKLSLQPVHPEWLLVLLNKSKINLVTRLFRSRVMKGRFYVNEAAFAYQSELLNSAKDNTVYEGWFQSYKYLQGIEDQIRKDFSFKSPILDHSATLLKTIKSCNSVCLNVRRTDFVANDNLNVTDLSYFTRGVDHIRQVVNDPNFFIFSDDIKWCRENIKLDYPMTIVDHTHKGKKFGNYMQLMKACKHFIIPNSSFAWWAAWLCEHESKQVVVPERWFNDLSIDTSDLTPPEWQKI